MKNTISLKSFKLFLIFFLFLLAPHYKMVTLLIILLIVGFEKKTSTVWVVLSIAFIHFLLMILLKGYNGITGYYALVCVIFGRYIYFYIRARFENFLTMLLFFSVLNLVHFILIVFGYFGRLDFSNNHIVTYLFPYLLLLIMSRNIYDSYYKSGAVSLFKFADAVIFIFIIATSFLYIVFANRVSLFIGVFQLMLLFALIRSSSMRLVSICVSILFISIFYINYDFSIFPGADSFLNKSLLYDPRRYVLLDSLSSIESPLDVLFKPVYDPVLVRGIGLHNFYIELWFTSGIIGIASIVFLLIKFFCNLKFLNIVSSSMIIIVLVRFMTDTLGVAFIFLAFTLFVWHIYYSKYDNRL